MGTFLIHGALGSGRQLARLQQDLPPNAVQCIELAGHGSTPFPPEGLSFERFVQDIDHAVGADQHVDLFGYSMGGYAALLYALHAPHKVRSVVTLGTKLKWDREGLDRELRMLQPAKMKEKVPQFVAELERTHSADGWEPLVHSTAALITGLHEHPALTPQVLGRIACPVLLCVGDRDGTAVPTHTREMAAYIPQATVLELPDTPHPFDTVKLDVLVPHLRRFWKEA